MQLLFFCIFHPYEIQCKDKISGGRKLYICIIFASYKNFHLNKERLPTLAVA